MTKEKLQTKLLYATITPLIILGLFSVIVAVFQFNKYINNEVYIELKNAMSSVMISLDEMYEGVYGEKSNDGQMVLMKGEYQLTGEQQYFIKLKDNTGLDYSICYGDIRVFTTIQDKNGYITGTYVNDGIYELLSNEPVYCKNADIYDVRYFAYYTPITDDSGNVIGSIAIAKPADDVKNRLTQAVIPIIIATSVIVLIAGVLIFLFTQQMMRNITEIRKFVHNIASGEFGKRISDKVYNRNDELGEIGHDIVVMRNTLRDLLEIDPLTSLYNRRTGEKKLMGINSKKAHHKIDSYAFAIGDIDFFKKVNDTHGHDAGDEVLKAVAKLIRIGMKRHGFVARWGGEEFMIVFEGKNMFEAGKVLEGILDTIRSNVVHYEETDIKVTMTFGVVNGNTEKTPEELFAQADKKLYYGKEHGRNQVVTKIK